MRCFDHCLCLTPSTSISKCASHIPGKKSTVGDKPAQRRGMQMLELSRMPLARGVVNIGDFKEQQIAVSTPNIFLYILSHVWRADSPF